MSTTQVSWEEAKHALPLGTRLRVRVTQHRPFGIFVEIPDFPFQGLIQITDFRDEGRMSPEQYPAIGSVVEAVVLGFKETGMQVWLGIKASQLCRSRTCREE